MNTPLAFMMSITLHGAVLGGSGYAYYALKPVFPKSMRAQNIVSVSFLNLNTPQKFLEEKGQGPFQKQTQSINQKQINKAKITPEQKKSKGLHIFEKQKITHSIQKTPVVHKNCALKKIKTPPIPLVKKNKNHSENIGFGGAISIHMPHPKYPNVAKKRQIQGRFLLKITIHPSGRVENIHYMEGSDGHPILKRSIESTLKQWIFQKSPKNHTLEVPIVFSLRDENL